MRVEALIDVGSNSLKMLVVAVEGGSYRELLDWAEVTRLSEGLGRTGRLDEAAMARGLSALARCVRRARDLGAARIEAVGTMALRRAENRDEFLARAQAACEIAIAVISGEKEAELSFLGAISGGREPAGDLGVLDCGGQSTEFIRGRQGRIVSTRSLPVGARQAQEAFLPSDPALPQELDRLREHLARCFAVLAPMPTGLVGVGGTVNTLAAVMRGQPASPPAALQGASLDRAEIERQIRLYAGLDQASRRRLPGLPPERADIILAGAAVIAAAMDALGATVMAVSARGLRHGLLRARGLTPRDA